jgi:hypothetical protein
MPQKDFIPVEQYTYARCVYCGAYFNLDGEQVDPCVDKIVADNTVELEAKKDG